MRNIGIILAISGIITTLYAIETKNERTSEDKSYSVEDTETKSVEKAFKNSDFDVDKKDEPDRTMMDIIGPLVQEKYGDRVPKEDELKKELSILRELHDKTAPYFKSLHKQALEEMIEDYERDDEWKTSVEEYAEKIIEETKSIGTTIKEIDCRERLCKMVFSHVDEKNLEKFIEDPIDRIPMETGGGIAIGGRTDEKNEGFGSYVFFSKAGDKTFLYNIAQRISKIIDRERV